MIIGTVKSYFGMKKFLLEIKLLEFTAEELIEKYSLAQATAYRLIAELIDYDVIYLVRRDEYDTDKWRNVYAMKKGFVI